jgi:hypothetical protein
VRERSAKLTMEAVALAAKGCAVGTNGMGVRSVRYDEKSHLLEIVNEFGVQRIAVGKDGRWQKGLAEMEADPPSMLDRIQSGLQPYGASGGWTTATRLEVRVCFTRSPYVLDFAVDCSKGVALASCRCVLEKRYCFGE